VYRPASRKQSKSASSAKPGEHLRLVHACAHGADNAFRPQLVERAVRAMQGVVEVAVRVVDVQDVQALDAEPLAAFLDRAHDAVVGEVEDRVHRRGPEERLPGLGRRVGAQQPAYLGRQRELLSRLAAQHLACALLAETVAIQRSGVEEADATLPGSLDHGQRVLLEDRPIESRQRGGAEAEPRDREAGTAELDRLCRVHSSKISGNRSRFSPL
jgi:hypothetical protein